RDLACNVVVTGNAAIYSTFCQLREVLAKVPLLFLRVFPSAGNDRTLSFVLVLAGLQPLVFFFQAEDGIRDLIVTGVQTCALPICCTDAAGRRSRARSRTPGPVASPGCTDRCCWPGTWRPTVRGAARTRCRCRSRRRADRKSTRLNSSHDQISYAVFCLKKKKKKMI